MYVRTTAQQHNTKSTTARRYSPRASSRGASLPETSANPSCSAALSSAGAVKAYPGPSRSAWIADGRGYPWVWVSVGGYPWVWGWVWGGYGLGARLRGLGGEPALRVGW